MASDLTKYSAIIAISGDGTLNEIFTALIARPDSANAVPAPRHRMLPGKPCQDMHFLTREAASNLERRVAAAAPLVRRRTRGAAARSTTSKPPRVLAVRGG